MFFCNVTNSQCTSYVTTLIDIYVVGDNVMVGCNELGDVIAIDDLFGDLW